MANRSQHERTRRNPSGLTSTFLGSIGKFRLEFRMLASMSLAMTNVCPTLNSYSGFLERLYEGPILGGSGVAISKVISQLYTEL